MIKIDFEQPNCEIWKEWKKKCKKATISIIKAHDKKGLRKSIDYQIKPIYKDKDVKRKYYMNIKGPFNGKCAYCDSLIIHDQYGDIDHFRPAKEITDINNNIVMIVKSRKKYKHPGYYWLAYDWKNLFPTCEKCNRPSKPGERAVGKHSRFPVMDGFYAKRTGEEIKEKPLLINPVTDDPTDHLDINLKTGFMAFRTPRGKACIEVFGFNERNGLPQERMSVHQEALALIVRFFTSYKGSEDEKDSFLELCKYVSGKKPHSFVGRKTIMSKSEGFYNDLISHCSKGS